MGRLIYSALCSVDGWVADAGGGFEWAAPDEEVHAAINDLLRRAGTHLYGRRMYDVLVPWETMGISPEESAVIRDFAAIWRAADKVVYSTTLETAPTERTVIEKRFDARAVQEMKDASSRDLTIGGPTLAAQAFEHGLVDECHLFLSPVAVGGGLPALPRSTELRFELVDLRRFANGVVHLHYRPRHRLVST